MFFNRVSGYILIENDVIITPLSNRVSGYILIENDVIITPQPNRVSGYILIENDVIITPLPNRVSGYILKYNSIKFGHLTMCNHYVVVLFVVLIVSINMQRLTPLNAEILKFH